MAKRPSTPTEDDTATTQVAARFAGSAPPRPAPVDAAPPPPPPPGAPVEPLPDGTGNAALIADLRRQLEDVGTELAAVRGELAGERTHRRLDTPGLPAELGACIPPRGELVTFVAAMERQMRRHDKPGVKGSVYIEGGDAWRGLGAFGTSRAAWHGLMKLAHDAIEKAKEARTLAAWADVGNYAMMLAYHDARCGESGVMRASFPSQAAADAAARQDAAGDPNPGGD